MKNVISWIKANPVSVVSLALMVLSLGAIGYFMLVANPALQARAAEMPSKKITEIKRYMTQSIEVPPANADDQPQQLSGITLNEKTIKVLDKIYTDLNRESEQIFSTAMAINQAGHQVMISGLFPDTPAGLGFPAKTVYERVLGAMLGSGREAQAVSQATGLDVPYLNAGSPLSQQYIQGVLDQNAQAVELSSAGGALGETRLKQQEAEQQRELINELLRHAMTINLYAQSELGSTLNPAPGFPLQIAALGKTPQAPTPSQLWEGQLELWVLQDIVRAIALANDVANQRDHGSDADGKPIASSVLNAPIKRLITAEVLPGYVGLHNTGGVGSLSGGRGGARGGAQGAGVGGSNYSPPLGGMTNQPRETAVADSFTFGPTGHGSNALYDVRHVRLVVHADFQRLPEFFNALGQVNFMTVLNARYNALDEYALLGEQYIYGEGDVVEAELIIETLWLREWTSKLMPEEEVKVYVGLADPPVDATPGFGGGYGDPAGGGYYGGGGYGGEYGGGGYGPAGQ